ncbi:MAG: TonB-dependent receptor [Candidatus Krumholzibacteriota bacterium]|nr:TonB-dependent receptor [Candidatus Krumholzibacteriota bacterium]
MRWAYGRALLIASCARRNFDAATIRRAATALGLRSEASTRFEKSLDPGNTVLLDGYSKLDLGAIITFDDRVTIQISADNITDKGGLTEGDPRNPAAPNGRFILPRTVTVSVGYAF